MAVVLWPNWVHSTGPRPTLGSIPHNSQGKKIHLLKSENTHLDCKGKYHCKAVRMLLLSLLREYSLTSYEQKYHCTDDLLFKLIGFGCFSYVVLYVVLTTDVLVWSSPKHLTGGQWHSDTFPLKYVSSCSLLK